VQLSLPPRPAVESARLTPTNKPVLYIWRHELSHLQGTKAGPPFPTGVFGTRGRRKMVERGNLVTVGVLGPLTSHFTGIMWEMAAAS